MKSEYEVMAQEIRYCSKCPFRDPNIEPLFPVLPASPVFVMFVGENPSWAEGQDTPFAETTVSGQALEAHYLRPLGLTRDSVWITDLFKCRYPKSNYRAKAEHEKVIQEAASTCAHEWLLREIELIRPRVLVTLSDKEVYQRLRRAFHLPVPTRFREAAGKPYPVDLDGRKVTLFPMVHPDVSRLPGEGDQRKKDTRQIWAPLHRDGHVPALATLIY